MQMMKWSALALAVAAGTSQVAFASAQSESKGFIEDSKLDVFSRALYMNRDFRNGAGNIPTVDSNGDNKVDSEFKSGYREETGLGVRVLFESGFTQGTVGVGVDAHSLTSVILDSGKGRTGTGQFATDDSSGNPRKTTRLKSAALSSSAYRILYSSMATNLLPVRSSPPMTAVSSRKLLLAPIWSAMKSKTSN